MKSGRWCLLTAFDSAYAPVAALSVPTMRAYAARHGLDFQAVLDPVAPRGIVWAKLLLAQERFRQGYDFVFWVDADALFRRLDRDVRTLIEPGGDLYFANEAHVPAPAGRQGRLNAGVFILRNTPLVHQFLDDVLARPESPEWRFKEQSAIHAVFGFQSMMAGNFDNADPLDRRFTDRLRWLPIEWNCGAGFDRGEGTVIRHFFDGDVPLKTTNIELVREIEEALSAAAVDETVIEDVVYRSAHALIRAWRQGQDRERSSTACDAIHSRSWLFKRFLALSWRKAMRSR